MSTVHPDGRWRQMQLHGVQFRCQDASVSGRFVRHLALWRADERLDLITPPEHGSIAPRVVGLPTVADDPAVVEVDEWQSVVQWLQSGGRLGSYTMHDLAALACVASPAFAGEIGRVAAHRVVEHGAWRQGPLRAHPDHPLAVLERAAESCERARAALLAARTEIALQSGHR